MVPLVKPLDIRKFESSSYHALGACFNPYRAFLRGREVKRLKRSRIPLVKVRWNSKRGPEFTWEREDQFKKKYPHLFTKTTPSSSAASSHPIRDGISRSKFFNHSVSLPTTAKATNSYSIVKPVMQVCFSEAQEIAPPPRRNTQLLVDELSLVLLIQLALVASSTEPLDSIFNKIQKIVSRLAILGVVITQEELNSKFLTSLPLEWNTHVVVWMNKAKIETMSIDDLYNNFKIVEQSYCLELVIDNDVYAFMVKNPNGYNLLQQDLEQIHEDDLEAIDLKWQLSLLSMRAKRYYQRTCKKIFINANDTAGYDKSKVECFNCHKMGHFARKCRAPRNKEGQFRNQDNTRKHGNNEETSSKAMLAIDGVGFDWSDMAEEQVLTNMGLMRFQTLRKNEVLFHEEVAVLKREVACKDYEINVLKIEFEKVKLEKEGIEFKIEKFNNATKSLNQLLESQINEKSKKGLGYNAVPLLQHP
ncbi:ribonuclease H-like domain-containing protein [Tanacetum coccineum]